jgi:hypothetical protein
MNCPPTEIVMNRTSPLFLAVSMLACAAQLSLVAWASAPRPLGTVPPALDPGASSRVLSTVAATGVQVYECRVAADASAASWAFVAPDAVLFDAHGRQVGTHGAGPVWTGNDGSRVLGSVQARADAPAAGSIPWLLLSTRSTGGPGEYSRVSHIQRLHTEGGVAPAGGCAYSSVGQRIRVPYRADYRLFVPA